MIHYYDVSADHCSVVNPVVQITIRITSCYATAAIAAIMATASIHQFVASQHTNGTVQDVWLALANLALKRVACTH